MPSSAPNLVVDFRIPDENALKSFVDASPWLSSQPSLLQNLISNYSRESPVFLDIAQLLEELHLSNYHEPAAECRAASPERTMDTEVANGSDGVPATEGKSTSNQEIESSQANEKFHVYGRQNPRMGPSLVGDGDQLQQKSQSNVTNSRDVNIGIRPEEVKNGHRRRSSDLIVKNKLDPLRQASLITPAETAISDVNVSTKVTRLAQEGYVPIFPKRKAALIKYFRFNAAASPSNKYARQAASKIETSVNNLTKTDAKKEDIRHELSPVKMRLGHNNANAKATRRTSFVGQNLPLYIQEQLDRHVSDPPPENKIERISSLKTSTPPNEPSGFSTNANAVQTSTVEISHSRPSSNFNSVSESVSQASRSQNLKNQRLKNVAVNSSSFYFHNDSSEIDTNALISNNDSAISERDKEYVSPSSFTRSLDVSDSSYYKNKGGRQSKYSLGTPRLPKRGESTYEEEDDDDDDDDVYDNYDDEEDEDNADFDDDEIKLYREDGLQHITDK